MIPTGWEEVSIDDVATELKSGLSRKLSSYDIGLPMLRSNNLIEQEVDFSDLKYWYVTDPQGANTSNFILRDGDILVNFINSAAQIGKVALYKNRLGRDVIYTTNIMRLRTNDKIIPEYFMAVTQLENYSAYIQAITKPAVNQASFTTKDYRQFTFLLPPIPEQRKIAEILGTWDEAIRLTAELIAAKQQRKKGLMQRLLTGEVRFPGFEGRPWREMDLKEVSVRITDGTHKTPRYVGDGIPFLSTVNLVPFSKDFDFTSYQKFITQEEHAELTKRCQPESGDLLVSKCGTIGRTQLIRTNLDFSIFVGLALVKPNSEKIDGLFLEQLLNSSDYQKKMQVAAPGGTRATLTINGLEKVKILIPTSLDEQQKIAGFLQACDREIELLQQKLAALQQQKKGLMQRLLTGAVRVKV